MATVADELTSRVSELVAEFRSLLKQAESAGQSSPAYRSRKPKLAAYKLLIDNGYTPQGAVAFWREREDAALDGES